MIVYDDTFDANSIYNISKNYNPNSNSNTNNFALNNNTNNKANSSKPYYFNQENKGNYSESNSAHSYNFDALNKNHILKNNLFEENNENYTNCINNPSYDDHFVKMNIKLNINAQPYSESNLIMCNDYQIK